MKCCVVRYGAACGLMDQVADILAGQDHEVSTVSLDGSCGDTSAGVSSVVLNQSEIPLEAPAPLAAAYRLYEWLKTKSFEAVIFPESGGAGYYIALARHQGLSFSDTILAAIVSNPIAFRKANDAKFFDATDELAVHFMERSSVGYAGYAIVKQDLLGWLEEEKWSMPASSLTFSSENDLPTALQKLRDAVAKRPSKPAFKGDPLVTACIVHHDRPRYLQQAIASIEEQDYPSIELIIVDDGSSEEESLNLLQELEKDSRDNGMRLIRADNLYLGAARNRGATEARGKFILFMDDDDVAKPGEVRTFIEAARNTGSTFMTCCADWFEGDDAPREGDTSIRRQVSLGGALACGFFHNLFGPANMFAERQALLQLGGFTEEYGVGFEDWELFAKAVIAGRRLEFVPEPLFWYRKGHQGMTDMVSFDAGLARGIRPYLAHQKGDWKHLLSFCLGQHLRCALVEKEHEGLRAAHAALLKHVEELNEEHEQVGRQAAEVHEELGALMREHSAFKNRTSIKVADKLANGLKRLFGRR